MDVKEYNNACTEVLEILKYIPQEDYIKIPKSVIKTFEENKNEKHYFRYNIHKTLDEQNALELTKTFIAILFRDYWATKEQRLKIILYENS